MSRFSHPIQTYSAFCRPPTDILSFICKCDFRSNHWASHWLWIHRRPCPHLNVQHVGLTSLWKNFTGWIKGALLWDTVFLILMELCWQPGETATTLVEQISLSSVQLGDVVTTSCSGCLWVWVVSSMVKCCVGVISRSTAVLYKIERCDS